MTEVIATEKDRETKGLVQVFVPDLTYHFTMEDEHSEAISNGYRKGLEAEFDAEFLEANIGPGFDIPAFSTVVDVSVYFGAGFALFFKGAEIVQGWEAWASAYKRLHRFLHRRPTFDRGAAAIVALDRIIHATGKPPERLKLVGYSAELSFVAEGDTIAIPLEIGDTVPDLNLGITSHIFSIEVDGVVKVARVTENKVEIL